MISRLCTTVVVLALAGAAFAVTPANAQQEPMPGPAALDTTRTTGLDSADEARRAADAARQAEIDRVAEALRAAEEAKRAVEEAKQLAAEEVARQAEIARRSKSEFARAIAREWQALDYVTQAFLRLMPEDSLLRIVATSGRKSTVGGPFGVRGRAESRRSGLPRLAAPTMSQSYTTDSTVEALVDWYARRFGFEFVVHRTLVTSPEGSPDTLIVARAVRRVGNTMISLMIFNPTQTTAGKRKAAKTVFNDKTTVSVEERCFRSREELIVEGPDAMVEFTWKVPYRDLIVKTSSKYQIDPYLVAALVQQESGFNAGAMSVDSAMGLTQMIPGTAEMMGVADPTNPRQSLEGGIRYLKLMLKRFSGDVVLALAAYNAGPGNVDKYRGVPPFAETRDYVKRIMARYTEKAGGSLSRTAKVVRPRT